MTQEELNEVLRKHNLWLEGKEGGKRADMRGLDLRGLDLRGLDMRGLDMRGVDMQGADIDYSARPLRCGSLKAHVDDRIAIQLLYHTLSVVQYSPYVSEELKRTLLTEPVVDIANRFHRVYECGKLKTFIEEEEEDA